ncbi:hypothetical protein ACFLTH_09395 [Bacteroidota bacterium]
MDRYLDRVRKQSGGTSGFNFLKNFVDEEVPEIKGNEVHVEYKEPSFFRKLFSWKRRKEIEDMDDELSDEEKEKLEAMEEEIETLENEESELEGLEEEIEERRESLMNRFMQKLYFFKRRHREESDEDFDLEVPPIELEEDVKEVLKVVHQWLEKLPSKAKTEFKSSSDFEKYKEILIKYGLVKEKTKEIESEPEKKKSVKNTPVKTIKK